MTQSDVKFVVLSAAKILEELETAYALEVANAKLNG